MSSLIAASTWQFTGKSYKAVLPTLAALPPSTDDQDVRSQSSAPLGIATTGSNNAQSNSGPSHALSPVSSHAISPGQGPYQMYYPPVAFQYRGQPTSMQHYPTGPIASSQPGNPQHIAFGPQQLIGQMPFSPNQREYNCFVAVYIQSCNSF